MPWNVTEPSTWALLVLGTGALALGAVAAGGGLHQQAVRIAQVDGQPIVIQLWKGWCEQFLGSAKFPGGIGAEVDVWEPEPTGRGNRFVPDDLDNCPDVFNPIRPVDCTTPGDFTAPLTVTGEVRRSTTETVTTGVTTYFFSRVVIDVSSSRTVSADASVRPIRGSRMAPDSSMRTSLPLNSSTSITWTES